MSLERCPSQSRNTLRDHYQELAASSDPRAAESGRQMLELIEALKPVLTKTSVWGLTSHYRLMLLSAPNDTTKQWVGIDPPIGNSFTIDYLFPGVAPPWPDARVVGRAEGVAQAVTMVLRAIERSGGWNRK